MPVRCRLVVGALLTALWLAGCGESEPTRVVKHDYPEPESPGARLLTTHCSGCHAAPLPDVHTAAEWPNVVYRMQQHRMHQAYDPLPQEDVATLIGYLQRHAKEGS